MSTKTTKTTRNPRRVGDAVVSEPLNEVILQGHLTRAPEPRVLPSGDEMLGLRLSVSRVGPARQRQSVDWVDCSVWVPRLRTRMAGWRQGDQVRLEGALRRRFFRTAGGPQTRLEVEVSGGRMLRRAPVASQSEVC